MDISFENKRVCLNVFTIGPTDNKYILFAKEEEAVGGAAMEVIAPLFASLVPCNEISSVIEDYQEAMYNTIVDLLVDLENSGSKM